MNTIKLKNPITCLEHLVIKMAELLTNDVNFKRVVVDQEDIDCELKDGIAIHTHRGHVFVISRIKYELERKYADRILELETRVKELEGKKNVNYKRRTTIR